ncbi:hypothetical protein DSO57_1013096 [Entomophthora muscae]|uniref:Uncharacterized protein n=1 Tax=Entomophthora muscae TaxID=34485 RepID=A0ACC2T6R6_9FUNG|nr:hypothetical protein DSO57_1013096 [Entomophthora muscae]
MVLSLDLKDYITAALNTLPDPTTYSCRVVIGAPWSVPLCQEVQGEKIKHSGLVERLILVTQSIKKEDSAEPENILVFGLTAYEGFIEISKKSGQYITIIDKVDTSGFHKKTAGAKAVIQGYLCWRSQLNNSGNHLVYVFARAQPQYLFRMSSNNPLKRVLSDSHLIRWWKGVLSDPIFPTADQKDYVKSWFIPGLTRNETYSIDPLPSADWVWGTAYPQDSVASHVILQLPDDAKSRLLKTDSGELPVQHFLDILAHSEECGAGRRAGLFYLVSSKDGCDYPSLEEVLPGIKEELEYCQSDSSSNCSEPSVSQSEVESENSDSEEDESEDDEIEIASEDDNDNTDDEPSDGIEDEEIEDGDVIDVVLHSLMEDVNFSTIEDAISSTKFVDMLLDSLDVPVWVPSAHPSLIATSNNIDVAIKQDSGLTPTTLPTSHKRAAPFETTVNVLTPKRKSASNSTLPNDLISKKPRE